MNKQEVGKELKAELAKGYDVIRISRWAYRFFLEHSQSLDPELLETIAQLFSMEDDPQFELTPDALTKIANKLIATGEKEELGNPIPEIKDIAEAIGGDWLMCPLCQEAWESVSKYGMVRCPKCNSKLHNPEYGSLTEAP